MASNRENAVHAARTAAEMGRDLLGAAASDPDEDQAAVAEAAVHLAVAAGMISAILDVADAIRELTADGTVTRAAAGRARADAVTAIAEMLPLLTGEQREQIRAALQDDGAVTR